MKLHYSQTWRKYEIHQLKVSVPYEITLLSNCADAYSTDPIVSVPYEITLLSNMTIRITLLGLVSVPYEITLLSNSFAECLRVI